MSASRKTIPLDTRLGVPVDFGVRSDFTVDDLKYQFQPILGQRIRWAR